MVDVITTSSTIPPTPRADGRLLLAAISLVIIGVGVFQIWGTVETRSAALLVRAEDGSRSVQSISLSTGAVTALPTVSLEGMNSRSLRTFTLADGTVLAVEASGIVRRVPDSTDGFTLLVASAVPTSPLTPLSVWGDGMRVAWVNPADRSIQVFEKNERGVYLPVFVRAGIPASSLQFTADGSALVVAKIGLSDTDVSLVPLDSTEVRHVARVPGFATVIPIIP